MSFLAPIFLIAGAAIAGPILFHLIRRVARERVQFSSTLFLHPTPPKVTRRKRVDDVLLLVLRCLCVLLMALAFARPLFSRSSIAPLVTDDRRQKLLLIDTSASMQRDGVWEKARSIAERHLADAGPDDQVAIASFDRRFQSVITFEEWNGWSADQRKALALARLETLSPNWNATQLGAAMISAVEHFQHQAVSGNAPERKELILISDLQEGAKLDGLQGYEWPRDLTVVVDTVAPARRGNVGIHVVSSEGKAAGPSFRVVNARDTARERFKVQVLHSSASPEMASDQIVEAYVAPGQMKTMALELNESARTAELRLEDPEPFDNRAYVVVPQTEHVAIAWLGSEAANDPAQMRFYFDKAFPETKRRRVEVAVVGNNQPVSAAALREASLTVVSRALNAAEADVLKQWIASGNAVLMMLPEDATTDSLVALTGVDALRVSEASGRFVLLGKIDFNHPLFAPFADPRFSDFTKIHFWKHRRLDLPAETDARVVAGFDDDSPALVQFTIGKGSLLVLTSGWHPADSQLAVSSKFPPLMQTLLSWAMAAAPSRSQFVVGDSIPSPISTGSAVEWQSPDGKREMLPAGTAFVRTDVPGFYTARFDGKERQFAVNLSADESRTTPGSVDQLAKLGVPLKGNETRLTAAAAASQSVLSQKHELEGRQKLWRWLIAGALLTLIAEMVLSGRLMRKNDRRTKDESQPAAAPVETRKEEFA